MKLLNPFAGYRAASGHIFYHVVFFIASFSINIFGDEISRSRDFDPTDSSAEEIEAIEYLSTAVFGAQLLRYCHAAVIVLQIVCYILDNYEPSLEEKIKAKAEVDGVELSDLQGLSLTGQAIDPKQVLPAEAKSSKAPSNAIVNFEDTTIKPITQEDLNNNSQKPDQSRNELVTSIQDDRNTQDLINQFPENQEKDAARGQASIQADKKETKLLQNEVEEMKSHKQQIMSLKLAPQTVSRILGIVQIYVSQIAIFYAQWAFMRSEVTDEGMKEYFAPIIAGPTLTWLRIETVGYYSYVLAISAYIVWFQAIEFWRNQLITDIDKQINDFITYARVNMTWWGFSFMKIVIPMFLLVYTEIIHLEDSTAIESRQGNISYLPLVGVCMIMSTLQFVVTPRIFVADYKPFESKEALFDQEGKDKPITSVFQNYKNIEREFIPMKKWLIVLKILVFSGVIVCYFVFRGPELAYAIYIPLDILLELVLLAYRLVEKAIMDREKKRAKERELLVSELNDDKKTPDAQAQLMKSMNVELAVVQQVTSQEDEEQKEQLELLAEEYEDQVQEKIDEEIAKKLIERQTEMKLGSDTYSMAYKAFHDKSNLSLDLTPGEVFEATQAVFFVSSIQLTLVFVIFLTMTDEDQFKITMPASMAVLSTRFVCSIMMHLQVSADVSQGLQMMKYLVNHGEEFSAPRLAFIVGMLQFLTGFVTELVCIIFLGSLNNPIGVIIRFIALGSIAKYDNFYVAALPSSSSFKQAVPKEKQVKFIQTHYFRDCRPTSAKRTSGKSNKSAYAVSRLIYKFFRIFYASFIYYFLPYLAVVVPFFASTS